MGPTATIHPPREGNTIMAQSAIATAADYADAMMSARRAKNWLFLLLLLALLGQLAIFFLVRYDVVKLHRPTTEVAVATTAPSAAVVADVLTPTSSAGTLIRYFVGLTDFLGIILTAILAVVLLLLVLIMLVGRLIGVAKVTSALIWCVVLGILLFPWQAFLNWQQLSDGFRLPGVLYTWMELIQPRVLASLPLDQAILLWARFVGFPVLAIIILLALQAKSNRGLRLALGESDLDRDDLATTA